MSDFKWTDEIFEEAKRLNAEGRSASQIGRYIGCSRNAVIGKLHRKGVAMAGAHGPDRPHVRAMKVSGQSHRVLTAAPCPPDIEEPESRHLSIRDLNRNTCRWPHGDPLIPETFHYCGHEPVPGSPYCQAHTRMSMNPQATQKFQAAWGLPKGKVA